MADRKYTLFHSRHRPDGNATIWVIADREFSQAEASKKVGSLVAHMMDKCPYVLAGYNERFLEMQQVTKNVSALAVNARELEVVTPPKCVPKVVDYMKKNWKGKWTEGKPWK